MGYVNREDRQNCGGHNQLQRPDQQGFVLLPVFTIGKIQVARLLLVYSVGVKGNVLRMVHRVKTVVTSCLISFSWASVGTALGDAHLGPSKLIEATRYSAFARESYDCRAADSRDPMLAARKWTELAIKTAREFRTNDQTEQGLAAAFIARQVHYLDELDTQTSRFNETLKKINDNFKHHRLTSATLQLKQVQFPLCEPRFQAVHARVVDLNRHIDALISQADTVARTDPRLALARYKEAQGVDIENISIGQKLASEQQLVERINPGRLRTLRTLEMPSGGSRPASGFERFDRTIPPDEPTLGNFKVSLYHRNRWCPGSLQIGQGWISFVPDHIWANAPKCNGVNSFRATQEEIGSFGSNIYLGVASNGFHIKRKAGGSYNFTTSALRSQVMIQIAQGLQLHVTRGN